MCEIECALKLDLATKQCDLLADALEAVLEDSYDVGRLKIAANVLTDYYRSKSND